VYILAERPFYLIIGHIATETWFPVSQLMLVIACHAIFIDLLVLVWLWFFYVATYPLGFFNPSAMLIVLGCMFSEF